MMSKKKNKQDDNDDVIDTGIAANAYNDLRRTNRLQQTAIAALSVCVLILLFMVSGKKTEIIAMPPNYFEPVIVSGNYANTSYAASHAIAAANMMGNVNERNIDYVTDTVLKMLSPHLRTQLYQSFQTEVQILKSRRARQSFYIEDVMVEPSNNIIFVWGTKRTASVNSGEITERFTYEFQIKPNQGMPKITHFDSYVGIPRPRDPNRKFEPKPYLTRDLQLASLLSSTDVEFPDDVKEVVETEADKASAPEEKKESN